MATTERKHATKGKFSSPRGNVSNPTRSATTNSNRSVAPNSTRNTTTGVNNTSTTSATSISTRRKQTTKNHFNLKSVYNKINKNDVKWYWDMKKWSPIIIIVFVILYAVGYINGKTTQIRIHENIPAETIYIEVIKEPEVPETTEAKLDEEAVALAILADSSAANKSDNVKRILMWVAINRSEDRSNGYGGSLIEEINRAKQWQSYNPEGMYLQSTYDIAVEVLNTWRNNGPRPIYNDMLWSVFNSDGSITVRNKFKDEKGRIEQTFS